MTSYTNTNFTLFNTFDYSQDVLIGNDLGTVAPSVDLLDLDYRVPGREQDPSLTPPKRAELNIKAIRVLRTLELEDRQPTISEADILNSYVGWGAVPQIFAGNTPEWRDAQGELRSLLSTEEYQHAQRSTTNTHYTSQLVVDAIWDTLLRLGAKPEMRWLEPAVGLGVFLGRQPAELLPGAKRYACDKDTITCKIARKLYPETKIQICGFEETAFPENYFDGIISNVPFGEFGVFDPEWKTRPHLTAPIHNYFFARSMYLLRPGGILAFVTSRYTLDGYKPTHKALRNHLHDSADFLGAVRMPETAFLKSAGTSVVTDIIFLRKRLAREVPPGDPVWVETEAKYLSRNDPYSYGYSQYSPRYGSSSSWVTQNKFYHQYPSAILGTEKLGHGMHSSQTYTVEGALTREQLADALGNHIDTSKGFSEWSPASAIAVPTREEIRELNPASTTLKVDSYFSKDGVIYRTTSHTEAQRINGLSGPQQARLFALIEVRDALLVLMNAEITGSDKSEIEALRIQLNEKYDPFVKKFGVVSNRTNVAAINNDPDAPLLLSLETEFDGSKTAKKAPIFKKRILSPSVRVDHSDSAVDALSVTLSELGRIDWVRMTELTARSAESLQVELQEQLLLFLNPETSLWETRDEYLSGSVRSKLKIARKYATVDQRFEINAAALKGVQPEDIPPSDIFVLPGVTWVPLNVYSLFAKHIFGLNSNTNQEVAVRHAGNEWYVDVPWGSPKTKWDTTKATVYQIYTASLNQRRIKVYDEDADGKKVLNRQETIAAQAKQRELQDYFSQWLFSDSQRAFDMARIYNDLYNDLVLRTYSGSHLAFPGMARATLRGCDLDGHQKAAVWRNICQRNVLDAHSVGLGKTFSAIATGMELRRMGLIKRPMYVVPNSTLSGWQKQFNELYPQARVLVFSEKDLEAKKRKALMARIATSQWDAVVVPHSSFQLLPVSDALFDEMYSDLKASLTKEIREAEVEGIPTRLVKRLEKNKERLLASLKKQRDARSKDNVVNWEQLGVDYLVVDESHSYRKLRFQTKQHSIAGIDSKGNKKTLDLLMKIRYTQRSGRGVLFLTGTPVVNTMGELFSIMTYLFQDELKRRAIASFDDWSATFGRIVDVFEPKTEGGGYQMKARFSKFVNLPELVTLLRSFADIVTSDMVYMPMPELFTGERQARENDLNPEQKEYMAYLQDRAQDIRDDPRSAMPDNMLAVYTDAQKMALDIRMVEPFGSDHEDSRLNAAADNIYRLWSEGLETRTTQLVFCDLGKPQSEVKDISRFSVYDELFLKLVKRGVPTDELAHIYQARTKVERARLLQAVNEGVVRILMGSSMKMGVGVNVQKRLIAAHHLDVPHTPADLEQREGRILRQGNGNQLVHIYYYITRGSLDENKFGNVLRKAKFIEQLLQGKSTLRAAEDVTGMVPSLEMFQALASGDPRVLRKFEVDSELDRLSALYAAWKNQRFHQRWDVNAFPDRLKRLNDSLQTIEEMISTRDNTGELWNLDGTLFTPVSKEDHTTLHEKLGSIILALRTATPQMTVVGYAYGLQIQSDGMSIQLGGNRNHEFSIRDLKSGLGFRSHIEEHIRGLDTSSNLRKQTIAKTIAEHKEILSVIDEPWPYEAQYQALVSEQNELIKALGGDDTEEASAFEQGEEIQDASVEAEETGIDDVEEAREEELEGVV